MFAANMMKRAGAVGPYDIPGSPDLKVSVSNVDAPGEIKVLWLTDTLKLVPPKEEESRRRSPEMRYLSVLGLLLTTMVVWGIVRNIVPRFLHEVGVISQPDAYLGFDGGSLGIYSRRDARHLLEVMPKLSSEGEGRELPAGLPVTEDTVPEKGRPSSASARESIPIVERKRAMKRYRWE